MKKRTKKPVETPRWDVFWGRPVKRAPHARRLNIKKPVKYFLENM
jgi:hypothetical protein